MIKGLLQQHFLAAAILDLKQGWRGIKIIAKIAHDHHCVPMIVVKIYLTLDFHGISRNESACPL